MIWRKEIRIGEPPGRDGLRAALKQSSMTNVLEFDQDYQCKEHGAKVECRPDSNACKKNQGRDCN